MLPASQPAGLDDLAKQRPLQRKVLPNTALAAAWERWRPALTAFRPLDYAAMVPGVYAVEPVTQFRRAGAARLPGLLVLMLLMAWNAPAAMPAGELHSKAGWLAGQNIPYSGKWVPPGESAAWSMDCSNTARWLHREVTGRDLPRTASAQFLHFRRQGKFRRARPDAASLAAKLRPGDFLFWEHTYKPSRKPPVTHVMIYLGRDASGRMFMAGSQGSRGAGIYEFRPGTKMGGYRWFLWFRREGKFIGYSRP